MRVRRLDLPGYKTGRFGNLFEICSKETYWYLCTLVDSWDTSMRIFLSTYRLIYFALDAVGLLDSIKHHLQHRFIFLNRPSLQGFMNGLREVVRGSNCAFRRNPLLPSGRRGAVRPFRCHGTSDE